METTWTKSQKKVAKELYNLAREREYAGLIEQIQSTEITIADDVWRLREMLNRKAREMDEKYIYRYSRIILLFARLVNEGYLHIEELKKLGDEKYRRICQLTETILP